MVEESRVQWPPEQKNGPARQAAAAALARSIILDPPPLPSLPRLPPHPQHEIVPAPLIDAIAGLRHGSTMRCLRTLAKAKLIHHDNSR